jgi:hypothetical protein
MRKLGAAAIVAAILTAGASPALAAEVDGAIASVDPTTNTITLTDGNTYRLPPGISAAALLAGTQVHVIYEEAPDGKLIASDVQPST